MTTMLLKVRRNLIEMSTFVFPLFIAACSPPSSIAANGDVKNTSGLDKEAAKVAQEAFDLGYKHCGDSYYKLRIDVGIPDTLSDLRGVELEVIPDQLSEADRLNSVEWNGIAVLRYTVTRSHSQASGWGQWLPAHPPGTQGQNRFIKRSGRWEGPFDDPPNMGWLNPQYQPASDIECGAVPK